MHYVVIALFQNTQIRIYIKYVYINAKKEM